MTNFHKIYSITRCVMPLQPSEKGSGCVKLCSSGTVSQEAALPHETGGCRSFISHIQDILK